MGQVLFVKKKSFSIYVCYIILVVIIILFILGWFLYGYICTHYCSKKIKSTSVSETALYQNMEINK